MSARDAESGSSTYKGGSGRAGGLGNGGLGGGMGGGGNYGGGRGGGAARNGGIGNRTGLTTGNRMVGGMAQGRPGGMAMNPGAWGVRPQDIVTRAPMNRPTVPGLLGPVTPVPAAIAPDENILAVEDVPVPPNIPRSYVPSRIRQIFDPAPTPPPTTGFAPPPGQTYNNYFKNPTAYPQWSGGWGTTTQNYSQQNTYPGGLKYTGPSGLNNNWSNDDTRYGIDNMARGRGY